MMDRILGTALVAMSVTTPLGAQSIPISLAGDASSLPGVVFDVPIQVDMSARAEMLGSFAMTVRWDATHLVLVEAIPGAFGGWTINEDSVDAGVLLAAGTNTAGMEGVVNLGTLRFLPQSATNTTLALSVSELFAAGSFADLLGNAMPSDRVYCSARGRWGDIDGDGATNSRDALVALSGAVNLDVSAFDVGLGDVDDDAATTPRDALIIMSGSIGLDVSAFRIGGIAADACLNATDPTFALAPGDQTLIVGQALGYHAQALDAAGDLLAVTDAVWSSSNTVAATVSPDGLVNAENPGSTIITAVWSGGTASATVTVVASRLAHWVDATAIDAEYRIGTPGLPFAEWDEALRIAQPGDTLHVRSGRYPRLGVTEAVVVHGDTTGGKSSPRIEGIQATPTIAGTVELHNLAIDTGLVVQFQQIDTLVVRNVSVRTRRDPNFERIGLFVDSVGLLEVTGSRFGGPDSLNPFPNAGIRVIEAERAVFADNLISGFAGPGVDLGDIASARFTGNVIRDNGWEGLRVWCLPCLTGLVVDSVIAEDNQFLRNGLAGMLLQGIYRVQTAGNLIVSPDAPALQIFGGGVDTLVMSGDSLHVRDAPWIQHGAGPPIDSLEVSSAWIANPDNTGSSIRIRRTAVFRDTRFEALDDDAVVDLSTTGTRPTLHLRNVEFWGVPPAECDQCGDAIETNDVILDADSVRFFNLNDALDVADTDVTLRRVSADLIDDFLQSDCGSVRLDSVHVRDADDAFDLIGCGGVDSLLADSVLLEQTRSDPFLDGFDVSSMYTRISNSRVVGYREAIDVSGASVLINDNTIERIEEFGLFLNVQDVNATIEIRDNVFTCAARDDDLDAIDAGNAPVIVIENNTITDCDDAIDGWVDFGMPDSSTVEIRNNVVNMPAWGHDGIEAGNGGPGRVRVVKNTITGPTDEGSIQITANYAVVDSNTIIRPATQGIIATSVDSLEILDNVIQDLRFPVPGACCQPHGGIVVTGSDAGHTYSRIRFNRVDGSETNGIVLAGTRVGDTVSIMVDSNVVKDVDSIGVWIDQSAKALVNYNTVVNAGLDGILSSQFAGVVPDTIANNSITGSGRYGINNTGGNGVIEAIDNWFGDALGPGGSVGNVASTGDSVSANVNFTPFLTVAPMTPVAWAPPMWTPTPTLFRESRYRIADGVLAIVRDPANPTGPRFTFDGRAAIAAPAGSGAGGRP